MSPSNKNILYEIQFCMIFFFFCNAPITSYGKMGLYHKVGNRTKYHSLHFIGSCRQRQGTVLWCDLLVLCHSSLTLCRPLCDIAEEWISGTGFCSVLFCRAGLDNTGWRKANEILVMMHLLNMLFSNIMTSTICRLQQSCKTLDSKMEWKSLFRGGTMLLASGSKCDAWGLCSSRSKYFLSKMNDTVVVNILSTHIMHRIRLCMINAVSYKNSAHLAWLSHTDLICSSVWLLSCHLKKPKLSNTGKFWTEK